MGDSSIQTVHDLGVHLDSEVRTSLENRRVCDGVSKIDSSSFNLLYHLRQIRRLVSQEVTAQLVSTFILSRLDYCNSILACLLRSINHSATSARPKCRCATRFSTFVVAITVTLCVRMRVSHRTYSQKVSLKNVFVSLYCHYASVFLADFCQVPVHDCTVGLVHWTRSAAAAGLAAILLILIQSYTDLFA